MTLGLGSLLNKVKKRWLTPTIFQLSSVHQTPYKDREKPQSGRRYTQYCQSQHPEYSKNPSKTIPKKKKRLKGKVVGGMNQNLER